MRKFCRDTLREYGYGSREAMQNLVMDELTELLKHMDSDRQQNKDGRVRFTVNYFHRSFANLIANMMMGKRFHYDDPELLSLLHHGHDFIKNGIFGAGILTAFPFLKYVFPEALGYNTQMGAVRGIQQCAKVRQLKLNARRIMRLTYLHYLNGRICWMSDGRRTMQKTHAASLTASSSE